MIIDAFFTPFFPEKEKEFDNAIVAMIDVLRASTVVCAALHNGAKEIIPCETTEKAVSIYSELSKESRFLGGEREGVKPESFDAGNSPSEYDEENVKNKTVIISTSNGTKIFQKAKQAKKRYIACFANMSAVIEKIRADAKELDEREGKIVFLCAGSNGRLSYEDAVCAGAFIDELSPSIKNPEITDTALAARNLYLQIKDNLFEELSKRERAIFLKNLGFEEDLRICFEKDLYPVAPEINGISIKNASIDIDN